ncbi:lisH domain-containing protein FOPNL isoform X3 [Oncorhynchus kisutch]|uniref:lisH domain-containing protein FOPNL isoform X3 n=1 Tax=Oncorhynchus kisutch TaxID=8019 RepID=UPI0012DD187A|nr:lisH domain-containing protein FOPNL isoform X3 [Oncorhynchus kisutch]
MRLSSLPALRESLESRGVLGQLKARIRAEVFNALDDQSEPRPTLSHDNLLINELIREYLEFNKYRYTASVLTAESGQPEVPLDRQFMANELKVVEDPSSRSVSSKEAQSLKASTVRLAIPLPKQQWRQWREAVSQGLSTCYYDQRP